MGERGEEKSGERWEAATPYARRTEIVLQIKVKREKGTACGEAIVATLPEWVVLRPCSQWSVL